MAHDTASRPRARIGAILQPLIFAILGAFAAILVVAIIVLDNKPDLSVWHDVHLDEEFTEASKATTLADYRALEERLFAQLRRDVYDRIDQSERTALNRYNAGSLSDPGIWRQDWNRTYELTRDDAPYGAVLLHGYSDSPYSLRNVALMLHGEGAHVLGLRIPGHGTAPSGLKHANFRDMAAAVRIAVSHMKERLGDRPLYIVGYSNGAALAVHYTLAASQDGTLPRPAGLVLFSPEIGITAIARLAKWQARIGNLLGLGKLEWTSVLPEYDPFKYGSFAINAGDQVHRLTGEIQLQLDHLELQGKLGEIPPILAFQSAVDATVTAEAVVGSLFDRLEPGRHELVVFDVNRIVMAQNLFLEPVELDTLLNGKDRPYDVSIVTNRDERTSEAVVRRRREGETTPTVRDLGLAWPQDVYSLSHIALPFPPDDPLYGGDPNSENPGVRLGHLTLRGEDGTLAIPSSAVTRQRWNPFISYSFERIRAFVAARP